MGLRPTPGLRRASRVTSARPASRATALTVVGNRGTIRKTSSLGIRALPTPVRRTAVIATIRRSSASAATSSRGSLRMRVLEALGTTTRFEASASDMVRRHGRASSRARHVTPNVTARPVIPPSMADIGSTRTGRDSMPRARRQRTRRCASRVTGAPFRRADAKRGGTTSTLPPARGCTPAARQAIRSTHSCAADNR